MAFDGLTIANLVKELNDTIVGGRLYKIAEPETDELLITVKSPKGQYRVVLSANASLPLAYMTDDNKPSPVTAPNFCMFLRKHINNGRIISVTQPDFERIIDIEIEHLDELGDLCKKHLITEFMGKHSNIILCDDNNTILDSIKHVSSQMSSVREVLPGRKYFIPNTSDKYNPMLLDYEVYSANLLTKPEALSKAICLTFTGISTCIAEEICFRAGIDSRKPANCLEKPEVVKLYDIFESIKKDIIEGNFYPNIVYDNDIPAEFAAIKLTMYDNLTELDNISEVIRNYYHQKEIHTRIRQKSTDIRKIVTTILERSYKKLDIQEKQLKDTEKKDKYRIYGELINTYGYNIEDGADKLTALNYYTNEEITIPLDNTLTPTENANKYFARYNKLKRTFEAGTRLIKEITEEIQYLESIENALDIATTEDDLNNIKDELSHTGYIKKSTKKGNSRPQNNKPLHFVSSDGFHIYVGKNNLQNDELTFKTATNSDWWFHAKKMPGSHVIVKCDGKELPDRTFEEAASLAAYYSKGRDQDKVEIDYVQKKEVKKPAGSKPGFVVYYTNYSMMASTDISWTTRNAEI
ncbi:MAG: NFACT RNA binding domain-containing protein [Eubacteriales bacterium]|nr:NFACT RNA binding domain-containing protein [Eubacteriales bacterium]